MSAPLSRRDVIRTASILGVGAAAWSAALPVQGAPPPIQDSGLATGKPKPLKYTEIPGLLTKEQVAPHYAAHYGGALKRWVAIEEKFEGLFRGQEPLGDDAQKFQHRDQLNRMNSVILHELYFDNLTPKAPAPPEDLRATLAKRFGSLDRWAEDFRSCAMAAAGWAILFRDSITGKLFNAASDQHEVGVVWHGQPLVVCDVYEHAFYIDYQNRKQDYVNKFVQFLDWSEVATRVAKLSQ